MSTDLTSTKIKNTFNQLLHVDGGVTTTPKTVYDGDGTATALKVSTNDLQVNNSSVLTDADIGNSIQPYDPALIQEIQDNADSAAASAVSAGNSATAAANTYDQFDDRYLGSKSTAPTVDNDGNALLTGALYFNSVTNNMNVWTGSAWSATYIPVTGYAPLANPLFTGDVKENGLKIVSQADIGTAPNELPVNGMLGTLAFQSAEAVVLKPQASVTPVGIGDMTFQLTNNTTLVVKVKGSDGTVRSATLTLA